MTGVRVGTAAGAVRGRRVDVGDSVVHEFLGIPYAAPLVGAARFAVPGAVAAWDGERPAVEHGPTPPQGPYPVPTSELLASVIVDGDEFLNLSVWTPEPGTARLPVMVWIHGGAFSRGTHRLPTYDGAAFARDGVVAVGINYRLGALGFLSLVGAADNRGLRDQIAALEWVRDNIAAFGGDPDQVTVFGESAGAMSIAALLASPRADGLFRRAIVQSGNGVSATDLADARLVASEFTQTLGLPPTVVGVADLPTADLQRAQDALGAALAADPDPSRWGASTVARGLAVMSMLPTIDGDVLPALPIEAIRAGAARGVEVLAGTTRDEMRFFLVPSGLAAAVTAEMLPGIVGRLGVGADAVATYARNRPNGAPGDVMCAMFTDYAFRAGTADLVDAIAARDGAAWQYEFAWPTPVRDLRACHALELAFVFDTLDGSSQLTGATPPQGLADDMHAMWVRFASTGDTGWDRVGAHRPVRMFGDTALNADAVVVDPRADELAVFGPS